MCSQASEIQSAANASLILVIHSFSGQKLDMGDHRRHHKPGMESD
jgi:hypothetical protein